VLASQCLNQRIAGERTLTKEVAAWRSTRNKTNAKAVWRFTTADARVKLKNLDPALQLIQATSLGLDARRDGSRRGRWCR
jgi:hypothetical protein